MGFSASLFEREIFFLKFPFDKNTHSNIRVDSLLKDESGVSSLSHVTPIQVNICLIYLIMKAIFFFMFNLARGEFLVKFLLMVFDPQA